MALEGVSLLALAPVDARVHPRERASAQLALRAKPARRRRAAAKK